jgi:CheY-like chemotaxis protein
MMDILIVDDDHEDCEILTEAIFELNSEIRCMRVNTGAEALTFLHYEPAPTLIFLDGKLNGMSSQELLSKIRSNPEFRDIPIIIYSGFSAAEVQKQFLNLGASHFILKTGDYKMLKDNLQSVILQKPAGQPETMIP